MSVVTSHHTIIYTRKLNYLRLPEYVLNSDTAYIAII
jgi:hypothetical protein